VELRKESGLSVRRLALVLEEPVSTVGRWVKPRADRERKARRRPVSGDLQFRDKIKALCTEPRNQTRGHRPIRAMLRRRWEIRAARKTVLRVMREEKLTQPKMWRRPHRPKRVEKMRPVAPNHAWQMDMTSFQLSDLRPLFLILVTDCCTREIVGWSLDRRCRASEWVAALRMALEGRGLTSKELCRQLTLRVDNGAQPCSRKFTEYLGKTGVTGQYTGYNAPDDNAYVERVIRTVKEEEIWLNLYDTVSEARAAVEEYVRYYNEERLHSSLGYRPPKEFAAAHVTLAAA
jgi:putative transposase